MVALCSTMVSLHDDAWYLSALSFARLPLNPCLMIACERASPAPNQTVLELRARSMC